MAIIELNRQVETTGLSNSTSFTISENSTKIFSLLSVALYKDKERSVLTELSSNAIDAHKLVGKENEPIKVILPSKLSPELRIRDYGPGLSEENVIKFLTTYGESSKQTSDDFIGGFGIGSKSPASVTDSWTINSFNDGKHKQYLVHITSNGVPKLTKIVEKSTDETGIEVIIPVKQHDINQWHQAAITTYKFYPVKPIIPNVTFSKNEVLYETSSFIVFKEYFSAPSLLINHRQYFIDYNKIDKSFVDPQHRSILDLIVTSRRIVMTFNIGELDLSLSREDLQYTKKTILSIQKKLESAIEDFKILTKNKLSSAKDKFEFAQMSYNFFDELRYGTYLGIKTLHDAININNPLYDENIDVNTGFYSCSTPVIYDDFKSYENGKILSLKKSRIFKYTSWGGNKLEIKISCIKDIKFVIADASMTPLRVKQHLSGSNVLICNKNFDFLPIELKSQIIKASDLPKPVINRTKREKIKSSLYMKIGKQFSPFTEEQIAQVSTVKKMCYFHFTRANTIDSVIDEEKEMFYAANRMGYIIFGIKPGTTPPKGIKHAKEVMTDHYNTLLPTETNQKYLQFYQRFCYTFSNINVLSKTKHSSVWNDFVDLYVKAKSFNDKTTNDTKTIENINTLRSVLKLKKPVSTLDEDIEAIESKFFKSYPMIRLLLNGYWSIDLTNKETYDTIIQYVNLTNN